MNGPVKGILPAVGSVAGRAKFRLTPHVEFGLRCDNSAQTGAERPGGHSRGGRRHAAVRRGWDVRVLARREPRHRRGQFPHRKSAGLADPGSRHRVRRQRGHPQAVRHILEFLARVAVGPVRRGFSDCRVVDTARQRAHPHRHREQHLLPAHPQHHRRHRARLLPVAADDHHDHHELPVRHEIGAAQRAVDECRRPAAMARERSDSDRFHAAVLPGDFRTDQTYRRDEGHYSRSVSRHRRTESRRRSRGGASARRNQSSPKNKPKSR